jgi:hypothetical protein
MLLNINLKQNEFLMKTLQGKAFFKAGTQFI